MHFLDFFNVSVTFFRVFGYNISYIEFTGTIFGLISVWLATKANIYTWPTGIVNQAAFFLLFYQVQLYADMFLQVYFTYVCIYGWIFWRSKKKTPEHIIGYIKNKSRIILAFSMFAAIIVLGIISLISGGFILISVLSIAFAWGGVLSLIIASVRYWSQADNLAKVVILAIALGLLIWLAIKKFNK